MFRPNGKRMIDKNERLIVVYLILMAFLMACAGPQGRGDSFNPEGAEARLPDGTFKEADYILGPEDVLDILVWKNQDLSRSVTIRPDGKISLPLLGDIQAAGLTASQLTDSISEKLGEFKETPEVSIVVREVNSFAIFVLGEVARPGKFQLRSETTLLQALTLSGGFTQYAAQDRIVVLRRVAGQETRMQVRFDDIVSGKDPGANVILQRGDTIVVP